MAAVDILAQLDSEDGWVTKDGTYVPLDEMSAAHRARLLAWLRERAESLKFHADYAMTTCAYPRGEQAAVDFDAGFDWQLQQSAMEWLEETPLVTRLAELVKADEQRPTPRYIGDCNVCRLRVYRDADGNEVRKQGGGRPPETPHRHKKPYRVTMPAPVEVDRGELRGWEVYAARMGAF